jgi:hypothetical protein
VEWITEQIDIADPETFRRWERGECTPKPDNLRKLCDLFGMTPEALGFFEEFPDQEGK